MDTVEGMGVRGHVSGNSPRKSIVYLESEVLLLRGVCGARLTALPYASSCCCRYWEYSSVLQAASALTASHLGKDHTPEGGTRAEVGLKPRLSPRGSATKEEKCKSFHACESNPQDQLGKSYVCGIPE